MIALLGIFAGRLIDRVGRRGPLVAGCLLYGIAGTAPLFLGSLTAIIASRLVLGIAEAGLITISATLLADYWDERGRRLWLTAQGVSGPFLSSAVIAASGYLATREWNAVFNLYWLAFPLAFACWFVLPEPVCAERRADEGGVARGLVRTIAPMLVATLIPASLFYVWIVQGGLAFRGVGIVSPARQGEIFAFAHLGASVSPLLFAATGPLDVGVLARFAIFGWLGLAAAAALVLLLATVRRRAPSEQPA